MDLFTAKIRKVGGSYGILIPKEQLAAMGVREGDEVNIAMIRQRDEKAIEEGVGSGKGLTPFVRDKRDRY